MGRNKAVNPSGGSGVFANQRFLAAVGLLLAFAEIRTLTSSPKISEFHLSSLGKLEYRTYIAEFGGKWSPSALILEFSGIYGNGSTGTGTLTSSTWFVPD